jgi:hypothetical protein
MPETRATEPVSWLSQLKQSVGSVVVVVVVVGWVEAGWF